MINHKLITNQHPLLQHEMAQYQHPLFHHSRRRSGEYWKQSDRNAGD